MEDLNRLEWYDLIPRLPYVQPRYYPFSPHSAPTFNPYLCKAIQPGVSTLNTYVAPLPARGPQYYTPSAIGGNGIVLYGNAPTVGIYTGVQQE